MSTFLTLRFILTAAVASLEFPASLRGSEATEAISRNSRIPHYVILGLDPRISAQWNSRIL
ncbi:MAG: hypothetical protein PUJ16_04520 [Campylobacteraceae bacterium]|nr:hypothetical protein [Campylobacteraceae bacterium]